MADPPSQPPDLNTLLAAVNPRNTLLNTSVTATIIQLIKQKFFGVDLIQHKLDPNLVMYVCELIEIAFENSKSKKVDKKQEVVKILQHIVQLSDDDVKAISALIEFLHSSGQIGAVEQEVVEVAKPFFKRLISSFF